jgi:hypothetical protein
MSGLLAVNGKKVLHIDRNNYYGADSASVNLTVSRDSSDELSCDANRTPLAQNLFAKFRDGAAPPDSLGANRDYNVDLIPKLLMACGACAQDMRILSINQTQFSILISRRQARQDPPSHQGHSLFGVQEHRRQLRVQGGQVSIPLSLCFVFAILRGLRFLTFCLYQDLQSPRHR